MVKLPVMCITEPKKEVMANAYREPMDSYDHMTCAPTPSAHMDTVESPLPENGDGHK